MATRKNGQALFKAFIDATGLSITEIAHALQTSRASVLGWASGEKEPTHENKLAIQKWSGGEVPYDAWPSSKEATEFVASIVPFTRTGSEG